MNTIKALGAACLPAILPCAAPADDMSYSYVDLAYVHFHQENRGANDGAALRGSLGLGENFFAFAEYTGFPRGNAANLSQYSAGIGGRFALTDQADLVGRVGWAGADSGTSSDSGYIASLGVRGQVRENLELEGHVIRTDFGVNLGHLTELAVGGRWYFSDRIAAGAEFRMRVSGRDQTKTALMGVRFAF